MTVSRILELLPAALEWMVLFRLPALRSFGDMVVRRMFFMPPDLDLSTVEFVVLTSTGRLVAAGDELIRMGGTAGPSGPASGACNGTTLADRFAHHLALVDIDSADCLGLGEKGPFPPVLLHLKMEAGIGKATALLQRPPSTAFYELLPAVESSTWAARNATGSSQRPFATGCLPTSRPERWPALAARVTATSSFCATAVSTVTSK